MSFCSMVLTVKDHCDIVLWSVHVHMLTPSHPHTLTPSHRHQIPTHPVDYNGDPHHRASAVHVTCLHQCHAHCGNTEHTLPVRFRILLTLLGLIPRPYISLGMGPARTKVVSFPDHTSVLDWDQQGLKLSRFQTLLKSRRKVWCSE